MAFKYNINTKKKKFVDSGFDGLGGNEYPELHKQDRFVFHFDLYNDDKTTYEILATDTLQLAIDNDLTDDTTCMILLQDVAFNLPADRSDISIADGRICCSGRCNSTPLFTKLGTLQNIKGHMQLRKIVGGIPEVLLLEKDAVTIHNLPPMPANTRTVGCLCRTETYGSGNLSGVSVIYDYSGENGFEYRNW